MKNIDEKEKKLKDTLKKLGEINIQHNEELDKVAILKDQKKLLPCCVYSSGQYGIKDQFVGLPVILSSNGVDKILEIDLNDSEKKELATSASHVKELCDLIDSFGIL